MAAKALTDDMRFEMPFTAALPRLAQAELDLRNLVARSGAQGAYAMTVTLLDSEDHRLLRSGIQLAHRVVDGHGDWYLAAPGWAPLLPSRKVIELDGHGDLPADFAELIIPFRRTAAIGAVAALDVDRREFWVRATDGSTIGRFIEERVTARRGGLTVSRYAQVTVVDLGLGNPRRDWIAQQVVSSGAAQVQEFASLESHLGAPATGRTDFPDGNLDEPTFGPFVAALLARRLRALVRAHLAGPDATSKLLTQARRLRRELQALTPVLEPRWAEVLIDDLSWLIGAPAAQAEREAAGVGADPDERVLRGDRYLAVLEALVRAVRLPEIGETGAMPTADVAQSLLDHAVDEARMVATSIVPTSPPASWQEARDALDRLVSVCQVAGPVFGRRIERLAKRARRIRDRLDECLDDRRAELRLRAEQDPAHAFELGRDFERESMRVNQVHEAFVTEWPKLSRRLS